METFTDSLDGKIYKTIKIGNQIWMADNLRYRGVAHVCPDGREDTVPKYGCLYTWKNASIACPPGWRLPTIEELKDMKDKDTFNIQYAGMMYPELSPGDFREKAIYWSDTLAEFRHDCTYALHIERYNIASDMSLEGFERPCAMSVRCVKEI